MDHQKVPNEEAAVENIVALEDRHGNRHLATWCGRKRWKWTLADGRSLKMCATARGRLTRYVKPTLRTSRSHKGPTADKKSRKFMELNNSVRDLGPTEQLCLGSEVVFY